MTEKETIQINRINMFLSAVANSTSESLNYKYNCCVTHQMAFQYIGIGKIEDGIILLNKYFWDKRKCNRIGYILSDSFNEVFIPDLAEKIITKEELYCVQNMHWAIDGLVNFQALLSQWFIKPDGNFHKAAMDALCEQFESLISGREYVLSTLYHPFGHIHYGKWIDNCYYLFLKVRNRNLETYAKDKTPQEEAVNKNSNEKETVQPNILDKGIADLYNFYFLECVALG